MNKDNKKVPSAILSCFLIAFVIQGILKLSGIFIFEKALNLDIFRIIDNNKIFEIIYYSLINAFAIYCMSFAFAKKIYSNKWYHYILIIGSSCLITSLKLLLNYSVEIQFVYDILSYVIIPTIISLTLDKENRVFSKISLEAIIITVSAQIIFYFYYLGLGYWSGLLNSLNPVTQMTLYASTSFLIFFEMYIGLLMLTLSMSILINKINIKE
jgi:hypothetical protein